LAIVIFFSFGRGNIVDGFQQSVVVKPRHPFQRSKFQRLLGLPRRPAMKQFSLVQTIDGLGKGVVIGVAFAAKRALNAAPTGRSL